ncbi:hypothetical protein K788_00004855 [Paraburkholderia caribensis MBA4]|uniref:Uncharacterized protein n=1 Tax=Paraburkholderia caribensis MBA4 TaxID=1323664 RepID=A0A0P0RGX9_9BURK|nr:hypothetical protein K788_00004855 [Paraburkholderia caribensis MBA4]
MAIKVWVGFARGRKRIFAVWEGATFYRIGGGRMAFGALGLRLRFVFVAGAVWFACGFAGIRDLLFAFAGIRDSLACFTRRPCAGRHLLFFAAAKKSRQKKAAHTASA